MKNDKSYRVVFFEFYLYKMSEIFESYENNMQTARDLALKSFSAKEIDTIKKGVQDFMGIINARSEVRKNSNDLLD